MVMKKKYGGKTVTVEIENEYTRYVIGPDGQNLHFIDKQTDKDYCLQDPKSSFVRVKKEGRYYQASTLSHVGGKMKLEFADSGVQITLGVAAKKRYFTIEVISVKGDQVQELVFVNLLLACQGTLEEPFAGCALALNLQTNVPEIPGPNNHLQAICYPRFGFAGAKVALIGCPQSELRAVMQEVVTSAKDLPRSPIGGPWALEATINKGSYLFDYGDVSEKTVNDWIRLAKSLGMNQLDFHGGKSFRFGDCQPNPEIYPRGPASLKAVIDKLHAAGIVAGLHTYAFFMDKKCPWVTPVPDPRLGKDARFTLAEPLTAKATTVPVPEPTKDMSTITGFFVRNSATLQIDDELITYDSISKGEPYAFTECLRGAYGTRITSHAKGTPVYHLKECFRLFTPDGDSTLLAEVAAKTAEIYNECGFDMIYLDALDGEDILAGRENGWHYGSKFVFEVWKRLKKPALLEMSTFHHHLWFVRSRMGAWDHPRHSHKKFIDIHCVANEDNQRMFLPGNLGWWALSTWSEPQSEPTFPDDIEYLCCKCLGTDTGLSLMGIDPDNISKIPALPRLAAIIKQYENLRQTNYFPESIKKKLRVPDDEFTLIQNSKGQSQFQPIRYTKHKVQGINDRSNVWQTRNRFGRQPLQLRIEVLMSAGPYDAAENVTLADFSKDKNFPDRDAISGISTELHSSSEQVKVGSVSGCYRASSTRSAGKGAWTKIGKKFSPTLDLSNHQALGVWIYGDGKGEVLNFQVRSPKHLSEAIGEHYVVIDFSGWRYFELIEPEGERYADYSWPYGDNYSIYRELVKYGSVESLSLWYNNLPPNKTVTCYLSPVKALPTVKVKLINPAVTISDNTIIFPTEVESGCYLEFYSRSDCKLYSPQGELICEVKSQGKVPVLEAGKNQVKFTCGTSSVAAARAHVTVISRGQVLDNRARKEE